MIQIPNKFVRKPRSSRQGYVYIAQTMEPKYAKCQRKPTKIGMCIQKEYTTEQQVYKRLADIERLHWAPIQVHAKTDLLADAVGVEYAIMEKYQHRHLKGEWFSLTAKEIASIVRYLKGVKRA